MNLNLLTKIPAVCVDWNLHVVSTWWKFAPSIMETVPPVTGPVTVSTSNMSVYPSIRPSASSADSPPSPPSRSSPPGSYSMVMFWLV